GIIGQEMFIALTDETPQCRNSPSPASSNHCASGCCVCDPAAGSLVEPRPIMSCSDLTVSASRDEPRAGVVCANARGAAIESNTTRQMNCCGNVMKAPAG